MPRTLTLMLALTIAVPLLAQPDPRRPSEERREEVSRRLDAYMMKRIREALELDEEQAAALEPRLKALEEARRDFVRERRLRMRELHRLLEDPESDDEALAQRLRDLRDTTRAFQREQERREDEVLSLLDPRQQVRYLVLRERFAAEIRNKLRELRQPRGRDHRPRGEDRPRRSR